MINRFNFGTFSVRNVDIDLLSWQMKQISLHTLIREMYFIAENKDYPDVIDNFNDTSLMNDLKLFLFKRNGEFIFKCINTLETDYVLDNNDEIYLTHDWIYNIDDPDNGTGVWFRMLGALHHVVQDAWVHIANRSNK